MGKLDRFRYRTRYFADSGIIGTKDFVSRVYQGFKNHFSSKHEKRPKAIQGEFVWHSHDDTDEVFIVLDGEMSIAFRDGSVELKAGEMFVVPKGAEQGPFADKECKALLVEPAGTINTGDAGGEMTADDNVWI